MAVSWTVGPTKVLPARPGEITDALRAALGEHERLVLRMAAARVNGGLREREERRRDVDVSRETIIADFGPLVEAARKEGGENG